MRDVSLLATKMRIPPRPRRVMPRSRLKDTLEQELPRHPLTLVVAPAGYGKTTLLAGRAEPPLPVAQYRARQQLFELRAGDLRFSQAETGDFLSHLIGLNLSPDDLALLYIQTEGWIAGLQLATLTH